MDVKNWKWFRYSEIFDVQKGKRLTKADMIEGEIPYIGAIDSNNGISAFISNNEHLHSANTISVSYNGSIAEAYYQTEPFWATDDVNVLYPKFNLNINIALFLTTIINREKYRFNYGRKWDKELMKISEIRLPIDNNGDPDWQWIENYVKENLIPQLPQKVKSVWKKEFDKTPISSNKLNLNTDTWQWFRYDEIFKIKKGFYNKKPEESFNGEIPFIGATDSNNGITSFHDLNTIESSSKTGEMPNAPLSEKIFSKNCITVSNNGSVGYAFYQNREFTCTHDINPLYLKNKTMNPYIAMFLCTIIEMERFRWAYGRKWRPVRMPSSKIKLPAILNDKGNYEPDWQWMENYIKGLPYSGCL